MTAEVVVMNKLAVALAADSAATSRIHEKRNKNETYTHDKIYNSVNKLFALYKSKSVGIMINGSAEIMDVPWESVIKVYREKHSTFNSPTLKGYAQHFINFLDSKNELFPESHQKENALQCINSYFRDIIKEQIESDIEKNIDEKKSISEVEVKNIIEKQINEHFDRWGKYIRLESLPKNHGSKIVRKYNIEINKILKEVFKKLPITATNRKKLKSIAGNLFCRDYFGFKDSGIVIAGFGDKETFPSVVACTVESIVANRLKYQIEKSESGQINHEITSMIIPYAQRDMIDSFISGMHPETMNYMNASLRKILDNMTSVILKGSKIPTISEAQKKRIKKRTKEIEDTFRKEMNRYLNLYHKMPILMATSLLPKDELATMAESLINLTILRKKMAIESETVGGLIDVAVISKGDGFVWIKKKQYYSSELNPFFPSQRINS